MFFTCLADSSTTTPVDSKRIIIQNRPKSSQIHQIEHIKTSISRYHDIDVMDLLDFEDDADD